MFLTASRTGAISKTIKAKLSIELGVSIIIGMGFSDGHDEQSARTMSYQWVSHEVRYSR